jgi:hypothetical protein
MTGGIREGVNMEKDGDSEEENDEEVVKQVVKRTTLSFLPLNFSPCFLSLIPIHPSHYLSPSFLSVILTTSPSFIPFNPPPHYLSSLSCNIIIHLI